MVKILPAIWETWVLSLGWEDPLERGTATHSSILAWRIPWTEETSRLQSMGSQRVGHDWVTFTSLHFKVGMGWDPVYTQGSSHTAAVSLSRCFLLLKEPRSLMTSVNFPVSLNHSSFFFQEKFVHAFCWAIFIFVTLILDDFKIFHSSNQSVYHYLLRAPFVAGKILDTWESDEHNRQSNCHHAVLWGRQISKNFLLINFLLQYDCIGASLVAQIVKNLPAMRETWVQSQGWEEPLEKGMATHSSILAWRIPWAEEPGGYSPWGCRELDMTEQLTHTCDCFTMLCWFLLYNEGNQPNVYIYLLPLWPLSHLTPIPPV